MEESRTFPKAMGNSKQKNPTAKLSKMLILQLVQKNFDTLGVSRNLSLQPYPFNAKIQICFVILGSYIVCNLVFAFVQAKTSTEYTQSIYMTSIVVLITFDFIVIIFNVDKLFQIINDCENLVNTPLKHSPARSIFSETVQFEQKFSGIIFFVMAKLTPGCALVPWMIYILFIYIRTDLRNAAFELPLPIWFPFDWKDPIGYLIAIAVQYVMLSYVLKICACVIALAFGLCVYFIAMSKCIKQNLLKINQSCRFEYETKTKRSLIRDQFIEYIEFDLSAKKSVDDFSDIFQQFTATAFIWSLISICGALLIVQLQIMRHNANLALLLITLLQVFYAFGVAFAGCEFGQRIDLAFAECSDIIDQFEWYSLPVDIQRMLPTIMLFAQQPVHVKLFGSTACNRENFKYVIKTAFSYFMVLRKFY